MRGYVIIDCVSDLHGFYPELEGGDLLIVAGDLTGKESISEQLEFLSWLQRTKYKKKIFIGGNHDNWLQKIKRKDPFIQWNLDYLFDSKVEFEGLKIWGSPWTTTFKGMNPRCKAFTVDSQQELADKFKSIPHDIDILITHSPPYGIFDVVYKMHLGTSVHVGSHYLYNWFQYAHRPKLHVFGHIHEGYGEGEFFNGYRDTMVKSVNASHVNEKYEPVNKPIRVIL